LPFVAKLAVHNLASVIMRRLYSAYIGRQNMGIEAYIVLPLHVDVIGWEFRMQG
jgi:hypothetical protein